MASLSRAVLVPIRSFSDAKSRLSPVLNPDQRRRLAEKCAERVLHFCGLERTQVICDDPYVSQWAQNLGVRVLAVSAVGLNASIQAALPLVLTDSEPIDVVIVHGDLAFPEALANLDELAPLEATSADRVFIVPDRHHLGTNVLGVGAHLVDRWRFTYGPDSFQQHRQQATTLTPMVQIIDHPDLGFDIDTPADLHDERVRSLIATLLPDWTSHEQ